MDRKIIPISLWFALFLTLGCNAPDDQEPVIVVPSTQFENQELFRAEPSIISDCQGNVGRTTLQWDVPGQSRAEIRIGKPEGPLFGLVNKTGEKQTGYWVKDGMLFLLIDEKSGEVLASTSVRLNCR